ncbi:hypothetical protein PYW07_013326 [Mythimna separata]|uniref:Uncharacterized protein n=1 Tax=Mythimna separata TaxID=271217 RepID=A0AAD8DKD8_MYTSE|nr:hypothetical protein PYW07_013314 [Mythimna separata]KAJ8704032.1 hypothetical protein PYW07_013326 [Mythimna separata]
MGTTLIDAQVDQLTESLLSSYHTSCPETLPRDSPGKQPWWGADLERKRGKVRKALNRAMNTCTDEAWDAYYAAKSSYKKCIRMIALEKLQWAIHSFHPSKAPGADGDLHYYSGVGRRWRHV